MIFYYKIEIIINKKLLSTFSTNWNLFPYNILLRVIPVQRF